MTPTSNTGSRAEAALPRIALTAGEPSGVGPDLIVEIAGRDHAACLTVYTDPALLEERAAALGRTLEVLQAGPAPDRHVPGGIRVHPVPLAARAVPGRVDPANAAHVLECIRAAARACLTRESDAVVTGPVHKAVINAAGIPFTGHTEFLAELVGGAFPVMMLMRGTLRVALVTTHVPLAEVCRAITAERVERTLRVVDADLRARFGIGCPRLLVLGVNPHAGEQGYLGREEQTVLAPALAALRAQGLDLSGPAAADTAFTEESLRDIDAVVAMYHDQGLPALKAMGFGGIVNVTLGLPFLRTSVDHGTALPLAGSGRARPDSLLAALDCAIALSARGAGRASSGAPRRAAGGVDR